MKIKEEKSNGDNKVYDDKAIKKYNSPKYNSGIDYIRRLGDYNRAYMMFSCDGSTEQSYSVLVGLASELEGWLLTNENEFAESIKQIEKLIHHIEVSIYINRDDNDARRQMRKLHKKLNQIMHGCGLGMVTKPKKGGLSLQ